MEKKEAQKKLLENERKIIEVESRFGTMKYKDYDEIMDRLFAEKRELLSKLEK